MFVGVAVERRVGTRQILVEWDLPHRRLSMEDRGEGLKMLWLRNPRNAQDSSRAPNNKARVTTRLQHKGHQGHNKQRVYTHSGHQGHNKPTEGRIIHSYTQLTAPPITITTTITLRVYSMCLSVYMSL
ncbi:hypothetical protein Pmani_016663 [Petrolisthes manimaculis]|uniref:Uncharacterized protein n=1 Tax=Petrolisthes manimaculis TaxID=1843537 RepID=A0AAE1PR57_9EUCA|nr:hypothetical protein Pmani_016663 [Petrolisthes manimaculis]